jgi:hypothetical protein
MPGFNYRGERQDVLGGSIELIIASEMWSKASMTPKSYLSLSIPKLKKQCGIGYGNNKAKM